MMSLLLALIAVFCAPTNAIAPAPEEQIKVCVVDRAPFAKCPQTGRPEPSYLVELWNKAISNVDDDEMRVHLINASMTCKTDAASVLLDNIANHTNNDCHLVVGPTTINEERKKTIDFVTWGFYTYASPLVSAQPRSSGSELWFWTGPFELIAWLATISLCVNLNDSFKFSRRQLSNPSPAFFLLQIGGAGFSGRYFDDVFTKLVP